MQSHNFSLDCSEPFNEVLIYEISDIPYEYQLICETCGGLIDFRDSCSHQKNHPLVVGHRMAQNSIVELEIFGRALNKIKSYYE